MIKILEILGPQKLEELECFDDNAKYYLKTIQKQIDDKVDLSSKFGGLEPELLEMMRGMLQFNPETRLSAKQCLDSPIFDKIRNKKNENIK